MDVMEPQRTPTAPISEAKSTGRHRLFRTQSLATREFAWQGRPTVRLGLPTAFATFASMALALALAALIVFGSYTRRVDLEGAVLPDTGLVSISSPAAGWIEASAVHEGDTVRQGALLYTLDVDTAIKGGSTQQLVSKVLTTEAQMLQQEIDRKLRMSAATARDLTTRIDNLKAQIEQLSAQITMQQGFQETIDAEYTMFQHLLATRTVSLDQADTRRQTWMQSKIALQQLEGTRLRLQGELNDAQYQLATNDIRTKDETDALRGKISEIDEKLATNEARHAIEIRAPRDGVVTAIVAQPGQVVGIGSPMLTIVPQHRSMEANLLTPSSAIGFVRPGERVLLRYSAFPYEKFGQYWGTVITVSHAALSPDEVQTLLAGASPRPGQTGPFYRLVVAPDQQQLTVYGTPHALPASMQVQAYVLLDRHPLYQWIMEPLYTVAHAAGAQ
jgi:membrane fusion protein